MAFYKVDAMTQHAILDEAIASPHQPAASQACHLLIKTYVMLLA